MTLIEMLIALALIGFILLGIAPLFIASVKSNYSANEYTSINILARDRLEQLMNRSFTDGQLKPGVWVNDQPPVLPDPNTGVPPASGGVPNPYQITYQVTQWSIPPSSGAGSPATGASFDPTRVTAANQIYHYKRIDVTVTAHATGTLSVAPFGIGARLSRVSGCLPNPSPPTSLASCGTAGVNCSVNDPCGLGDPAPCNTP